jgi:hypothetical protein
MCNKVNMKNSIIKILIAVSLFACGQNPSSANQDDSKKEFSKNVKKPSHNQISKFIPDSYEVLDSISGDLNLDNYTDLILILKKHDEENTSDVIENPEKRPLLILIGKDNGGYELAAKSNTTVYCYNCGGMMGDPYQGVTINNGYFSVEHYGGSAWRWSRIITYKFSKSDNHWFLHRDGGESFHVSEPEKSESNMRTKKDFGKIKFEDFDIFEDKE